MLTQAQIEKFHEDGFIVIEYFLTAEEVRLARSRFEPLFRGEFATGLAPMLRDHSVALELAPISWRLA